MKPRLSDRIFRRNLGAVPVCPDEVKSSLSTGGRKNQILELHTPNTRQQASYLADNFFAYRYNDVQFRLLCPDFLNPDCLAEYNTDTKDPLLVYLHGSNTGGNDGWRHLQGEILYTATQEFQKNFPCYVLAPQFPDDKGRRKYPERKHVFPIIMEFIDKIKKKLNLDMDRIYLVGHSLGATNVAQLLKEYPFAFSAGVMLSGIVPTRTLERDNDHVPRVLAYGGLESRQNALYASAIKSMKEFYSVYLETANNPSQIKFKKFWWDTHADTLGSLLRNKKLMNWIFN